jgi:hypothetical protein
MVYGDQAAGNSRVTPAVSITLNSVRRTDDEATSLEHTAVVITVIFQVSVHAAAAAESQLVGIVPARFGDSSVTITKALSAVK